MSFHGILSGRQVIEEQSTYEELFTEQQFEEERKEYYEEYAVNPALAFPRPIVITFLNSKFIHLHSDGTLLYLVRFGVR